MFFRIYLKVNVLAIKFVVLFLLKTKLVKTPGLGKVNNANLQVSGNTIAWLLPRRGIISITAGEACGQKEPNKKENPERVQ